MPLPPAGSPHRRLTSVFLVEWLFLVGALLLLAGVLLYTQVYEHRALRERERERLLATVAVLHDNIGRQLDSINRALVNIRDEVPRWRQSDDMAAAHRRLKAYTDAMPGVRTLTLIDVRGTVLASNRPELVGRNFRQRDYFRAAMASPSTDTLYVSPPYLTALGVYALNVVRTVANGDGSAYGIVSATLDPDEFRILLQSVRYAADMRVRIVHGLGTPFMQEPHRPDGPDMVAAVPGSAMAAFLARGEARYFAAMAPLPGEAVQWQALGRVQPAALNMDLPLLVVAERDAAAVQASWVAEGWIKGGLMGLLALTSAGLLFLLQRRQRQSAHDAEAASRLLRQKNAELQALNQQLHAQSEQLRALALSDGLTGVANRRRLDEQLQAEWRRCQREGRPLAVLMVDVDHFKGYNDRYGHAAGDACLQVLAAILQAGLTRSHDLVARYGGEEFVCLLPDCDRDGALRKAEALRAAVLAHALPHAASGVAEVVTISVGVAAQQPGEEGTPEALLAQADQALYRAKQQGRNRVATVPTPAAALPVVA